jgi:leucyl aminopeptidase (aminopeptidase T)
LKVAAVTYDFRAATMPGFSSQMIPTLKLDYEEVNRRVLLLKEKLDRAMGADVHFTVDGEEDFEVYFDLRFRQAHASTGRFPEKGTAGNLPSGEAYIVPYEGEKGEASQTQGMLPVQIRDDLVLFNIKHNRAVGVEGLVPAILEEKAHLEREPAYGNMAELGFGVLADFGILPVGKILLDEKLGFHVAFGRSEHFGGSVGPEDFSAPSEVIHLDRIYIPATQPRITVKSLVLLYENGQGEILIEGGKYLIF